jgi:Na+/H+ antiporter NhaD/arsenite permease-like protein
MILSTRRAILPGHENEAPLHVEWWSMLPFVLLLLSIAVLPLVAAHWWHRNRNKAVVAALFAVPTAIFLLVMGFTQDHRFAEKLLHAVLHDYLPFIVLLGSLYTVSGGIVLQGDVQGRPLTNTVLLGLGAVLANVMGTTGASMLLVRAFLRINHQRKHVRHLPIFFIFIVSNCGGLLTPLGDPPLFLGFKKGVAFTWTLGLWPQWLLVNGLLLAVFFVWDLLAYRREGPREIKRDETEIQPLRVLGLHNLLFIAGIVLAVLFLPWPWAELAMLLMAAGAYFTTGKNLREANGFEWHAIAEVAVLFAGIFVTMVPALVLLSQQKDLVTEPWQYFWMTGGLSSVLDNAPTYLAFASMASGNPDDIGRLMTSAPLVLAAIRCGAVFMGANTYIGNGPNFMVRAIAERAGYKMPSFFGYVAYSGLILLPIFVVVTLIFFPPW